MIKMCFKVLKYKLKLNDKIQTYLENFLNLKINFVVSK